MVPQEITLLYQVLTLKPVTVRLEAVAPVMFVHVVLFGEDCHWYVSPLAAVAFATDSVKGVVGLQMDASED